MRAAVLLTPLLLTLLLPACVAERPESNSPARFNPDGRNVEPEPNPDPLPDPQPSPTPDPMPDPDPDPPGDTESGAAQCSDGQDNDGDGFADCLDFECNDTGPCGLPEDTDATCADGHDNDADGFTDCADFDCDAAEVCQEENRLDTCADGQDNDDDGDIDCDDDNCADLSVCDPSRIRVVTWNVHDIGARGSGEYNALIAVARRIDADVLCFQEVDDDEGDALADAARDLGYAHVFQGRVSTRMAGGLTNACISRFRILQSASKSSDDISGDAGASETGRDIVQVRLDAAGARLGLFVVHLKSGFNETDKLRRAVETIRLAQAVDQYQRSFPGDAIMVMGDFNEEVGARALGQVFNQAPSGLPDSFNLGNDLSFPLVYEPFGVLEDEGLSLVEASLEDSSMRGTRIPSGRRIDYVFGVGTDVLGAEIYDSCQDNGVDDGAAGGFLDKQGEPLACGVGGQASDHRPVMVDVSLQ